MSDLQEQVQRRIDTLVGTGAESGLQVAVYEDGALIVDAVAGTADPATGRPLTSGTPIFSFSTGKNVAATLAHLLVARGFLGLPRSLDERSAGCAGAGRSWPARAVTGWRTRLSRSSECGDLVTGSTPILPPPSQPAARGDRRNRPRMSVSTEDTSPLASRRAWSR